MMIKGLASTLGECECSFERALLIVTREPLFETQETALRDSRKWTVGSDTRQVREQVGSMGGKLREKIDLNLRLRSYSDREVWHAVKYSVSSGTYLRIRQNKLSKGDELRRATICNKPQEIAATFTDLPGDPVRQAKLEGRRMKVSHSTQVTALRDIGTLLSRRSESSRTGNWLLVLELKIRPGSKLIYFHSE